MDENESDMTIFQFVIAVPDFWPGGWYFDALESVPWVSEKLYPFRIDEVGNFHSAVDGHVEESVKVPIGRMETFPWASIRNCLFCDNLGDCHIHELGLPSHNLDLAMVDAGKLKTFEPWL